MSSILTNMSAMTAVMNLAATQKALGDTQNEISTGMKVSSAKDDAAYWSIATNMRTQNNDLTAVSSALNLGSSVLGTATSALNNMLTVMQSIQADVHQGADRRCPTRPRSRPHITQLQTPAQQHDHVSASFNGINLLDGSDQAGRSKAAAAITSSLVSGIQGSQLSTSIAVSAYSLGASDAPRKQMRAMHFPASGAYSRVDGTDGTQDCGV